MELTRRSTVITNPIIFHLRRAQFVDDAKSMQLEEKSNVELEKAKVSMQIIFPKIFNFLQKYVILLWIRKLLGQHVLFH